MRDRRRHVWATIHIYNVLMLATVTANPLYIPQFLSGGSGRNIRHLPCVSTRTGETGVCMFAFTCAKANGTHLGTCIDRFYFGSCCKIEQEPDAVFPQDNTIEDGPVSLSKPLLTTTTTSIESNEIPPYFTKPKPILEKRPPLSGYSTQKMESTTSKTAETIVTKPYRTTSKKPLAQTTTESIGFFTFQSVQDASTEVAQNRPTVGANQESTFDSSRYPSSTGKPFSSGKPSSTGKPFTTGKPTSSDKPSSSGKPSFSSKPSSSKPSSSGKPSTSGKPSSTSKPFSTGKPTSSGKPSNTGKPFNTTNPSTGKPFLTRKPINEKPFGSSKPSASPSTISTITPSRRPPTVPSSGSSSSSFPSSSSAFSSLPPSSSSGFPASPSSNSPDGSSSGFPASSQSWPSSSSAHSSISTSDDNYPTTLGFPTTFGSSPFHPVGSLSTNNWPLTMGSTSSLPSMLPSSLLTSSTPISTTSQKPPITHPPLIKNSTSYPTPTSDSAAATTAKLEPTTIKPLTYPSTYPTYPTTFPTKTPSTRFPPRNATTIKPVTTTTRKTVPTSTTIKKPTLSSVTKKPTIANTTVKKPTVPAKRPTITRPSTQSETVKPVSVTKPSKPTKPTRPFATSTKVPVTEPTATETIPFGGYKPSTKKPIIDKTPSKTTTPRPTTTTTKTKPASKPTKTSSTKPGLVKPSSTTGTTVTTSTTTIRSSSKPTTTTTTDKIKLPISSITQSGIKSTTPSIISTIQVSPSKIPVPVTSTESNIYIPFNASTSSIPISTPKKPDDETPLTTYPPGLVTWTSNLDETTTIKIQEVSSTTEEPTQTDWAPITKPDGWIIINSPSTEKIEASTTSPKPIATTTETPFTTSKPITEIPTADTFITTRPVIPTTLSSIATVTVSTETSQSTIPPINMSDYKQVCGRRLIPEGRIVGGNSSTFGKWPWQISLRQWRTSTYLHKCGAALLNENWAITAAHCIDSVPPSDLLLRIGEYDLASEGEPYGYQERRVQLVASHPQFDSRTFEYDLALLRFYEPIKQFQPNILPICIPDDDESYEGHIAYVTGWGRLYEDGPLPSVLQEVSVPVINNTQCEAMYGAAGYIERIPHIFICAGWRKGGFDSCEGDSGGPMSIQRTRDNRWVLAGVISWGIGCAEPSQPGVYTRISQFRDWINQILQF
ncbi:mucin-2 [Leptopilina heterotoma]|uniref:mucin-2 n=1 Tax=Leptopilina heterotoma TaxID=63436 RepID=UPI001CA95178|nr:mucin-2 [Leptopilina heterotoma]